MIMVPLSKYQDLSGLKVFLSAYISGVVLILCNIQVNGNIFHYEHSKRSFKTKTSQMSTASRFWTRHLCQSSS